LSGIQHPNPLIEIIPVPLILDFSDVGDTILDPFCGIGTVGLVSISEKRNFVGFEPNKNFHRISLERLNNKMKELNLHRVKSKKNQGEEWLEPVECDVDC